MFKYLYQILRIFLFPLLFTLTFFGRFKKRYQFEKKYWIKGPLKVDFVFHVSSEGELEQVQSLIEDELLTQKKVLLIFTSESVEHRANDLKNKYPGLVILSLPVITYFPGSYTDIAAKVATKKIVMVRYDFFPELLFWARDSKVKSILLWASLKNTQKNILNLWIYYSFDKIVTGLAKDRDIFISDFGINALNIKALDLRPYQILKRLSLREATLKQKWPLYSEFLEGLNHYPRNKRIIFGNFWDYEAPLFKMAQDLIRDYKVVLVPHRLDLNQLNEIVINLENISGRDVSLIHFSMSNDEMNRMTIVRKWLRIYNSF